MDEIDFYINNETMDIDDNISADETGLSSFLAGLFIDGRINGQGGVWYDIDSTILWKYKQSRLYRNQTELEAMLQVYCNKFVNRGTFKEITFEVTIINDGWRINFMLYTDKETYNTFIKVK